MVTIANVSQLRSFQESHIPSVLSAAHNEVQHFVSRVTTCGVMARDAQTLQYGVHEALTNAVIHGNGRDPRLSVRLAYWLQGREVWIEIEDEGHGFGRDTVADPTADDRIQRVGGRGILLMEHYMDSVQFNARGNCVTMVRTCALRPVRAAWITKLREFAQSHFVCHPSDNP